MPKNKIIIALGALVALLPWLGFPRSWESFFQVFAGLAIIGLSTWVRIDRKITLKAKARARQERKLAQQSVTPVEQNSEVITAEEVTQPVI